MKVAQKSSRKQRCSAPKIYVLLDTLGRPGRVVIPKEIRRTMRIREGDSIGNLHSRDGEVIFKKYSLLGGRYCVVRVRRPAVCDTSAAPPARSQSSPIGTNCSGRHRRPQVVRSKTSRSSPELERLMEGPSDLSAQAGCRVHSPLRRLRTAFYHVGTCRPPSCPRGECLCWVLRHLCGGTGRASPRRDRLQAALAPASAFWGKHMEK